MEKARRAPFGKSKCMLNGDVGTAEQKSSVIKEKCSPVGALSTNLNYRIVPVDCTAYEEQDSNVMRTV
jgi:hypothetical protein